MTIYSEIIFPKLEPLMTKGLWEERRRLLKDVRGDILEIGPGVGENIKYLSPRVRSYFAIDPSSGFIKIGHIESQQMNKKFSIKVMRTKGEDLPLKSKTFDTAIYFLIICSANDPQKSLA